MRKMMYLIMCLGFPQGTVLSGYAQQPNQTTISAPLPPATAFLPHVFRQAPVSVTFPPKANS
ncbi:hypothetical protein OAF97_02160 [Akkermansiaceae bacterium]|nr:hypothetical protein [Akkermansiaceae bacterium]